MPNVFAKRVADSILHKADARSAGSVAGAAGEGLVGVWCRSCKVLPPLSFFLEGSPTGFLEGGNSTDDGASPGVTVCGK